MKVNILGTDYLLEREMTEKDDQRLSEMYGLTDYSAKVIKTSAIDRDDDSVEDLEYVKKKILRHEIIHAFFSESGLGECSEYAQNEEMVDWIAIQMPKIVKACKEAGCM